MGRRSFGVTATQINRMISTSNAAAKQRERMNLINSQIGIQTEKEPEYEIIDFDFNIESRVSHVCFLETNMYRKISKYVTQDGNRYPIYGDWSSKTKKHKKTIKLTNQTLEELNTYYDFLIREFSFEIVQRLNNEEKYEKVLVEKDAKQKCNLESDSINKYQKDITKTKALIDSLDNNLIIKNKKIERKRKSLSFAKSQNNCLLFSILTFGIHALVHSKKRINRLEEKITVLEESILNIREEIKASYI